MKISSIILSTLSVSHVGAFSVIRPATTTRSISTSTLKAAPFFADETENKDKNNKKEVKKEEKKEAKKEAKKEVKKEVKKDDNEEDEDDSMVSMSGTKETNANLMSGSIYDQIGFEEEQIALGIKPELVLEWIGNRDDMIERFKKDNEDNKEMTDERAEKEVDKFMMDSEMVNMLINYEQKKAAGELEPDPFAFDWFTVLVGGYLVFVVGSTIKKAIDGPQGVADVGEIVDGVVTVPDAVAGSEAAVQSVVDAVQVSLDAVQSTLLDSVSGAVPDVIQSTIEIASSAM